MVTQQFTCGVFLYFSAQNSSTLQNSFLTLGGFGLLLADPTDRFEASAARRADHARRTQGRTPPGNGAFAAVAVTVTVRLRGGAAAAGCDGPHLHR